MHLAIRIRRPWSFGAWAALIAAYAGYSGATLAGEDAALVREWWRNAVLWAGAAAAIVGARLRESERTAFTVLGCTLALWAGGQQVWTLVYSQDAAPPFPSWSDAMWLSCYAGFFSTLWLLARRRLRGLPGGAWLDAVVGVLSLGAAALYLLLHRLESLTGHPLAQLTTTIAYPVADVVLLGVLVGMVGVTGWRVGRAWMLLIAGMVVNAVADIAYVFVASGGAYAAWADVVFVTSLLLLAAACWQPATLFVPVRLARGWAAIAAPVTGMAAAAGLLGWTAVLGLHHPEAAVAALGALLLGLIRVVLTHRENLALAASRREAITDELTGLANRRHLLRRIDEALEPAAAGEPAPAALMLIDLDRFKELNDSLGHQAGDQLLTAFAGRLRRAVDHAGLAARLGGDEFAVLLPGARRTDALDVAARVHRALARTFAVAGGDAHIAASVGIALALDRGDTPAALLRRADLAMYEAKRGATGTHVSTPADGGGSGPAARLRRAIEAGEMEMHYQPQGELPSGGVVGVEALIRWRHPERGLLVPAEFLPALRDAGLMRRLTHTVIAQALEQAGRWAAGGLVVPIAVNVSAEDMLDPGFAVEVEELLACSGVPADRLRIEISENAPMADLDLVRATVRRLRAAGVEVALDDFGAGYSALAYLRQLEFDELKLDRSLVAGIAGDADGTAIVGAVVELAHTLGLRVVAEGVEDAESWRLLATLGCDVGQGFYLGRPVAPEELAPWLAGRPLLMVRPG